MSVQSLNAKSVRRIASDTGLPVLRGWGHGTYVHSFVTVDHRHGWWCKKDWSWGLDDDPIHFTSCGLTDWGSDERLPQLGL